MKDKPISTRPMNEYEKLMREKFYESLTAQSGLMDKLSERLLTLELAIPGLYATFNQLIGGEKATVRLNPAFYITFICWFVALILTLIAMIPKKWAVDITLLRQDPKKISEVLGMEDYFEQTALYKRRFLIASSILFFVGIFFAVFTIG
jgi:hypothetical protein